jgi:hypothetical protein
MPPANADSSVRALPRAAPYPQPDVASTAPDEPPRSLVERLGEALRDERVVYLQWKGNWKRARWMSGEGDIDLLVDRGAEARFRSVLWDLGFQRADPPPARGIAGIESYFGLDPVTGRLIHVHTHYRLVVGGYWRIVYRLPIETPLLESAVQGEVFRVAAAEFELIAFAVRMVQRYNLVDTLRRPQPGWLKSIQGELDALLAKTDRARLADILAQHLPCLDLAFIDACVASLRPGYPRWQRVPLGRELHRRMRAHARRPPLSVTVWRWLRPIVTLRGRIPIGGLGGKHLAHGGTVIALVGGDGSGKSTCTRELRDWLSGEFAMMTAHLGRPPRSLLTLAVGGVFKVARAVRLAAASDEERGRKPGYLAALRDVCTARDRYHLYERARQFALAGGISFCERYPVPQNPELCGPRLGEFAVQLGRSRLGRWLTAREARYYQEMFPPDLLIVLRVHPEIAVQRKTDEPSDYVRERGWIVWNTDWSGSGAHLVDAGRQLPEVLADLKAILWREL